ncbi:MAG TPA: ankyrin repeat domain-containing protein [Candidatus Babeliaceae bacterium]|nr:ankyrin repeat domain-containing protein [Candidatus Babeliaceae bacterium]
MAIKFLQASPPEPKLPDDYLDPVTYDPMINAVFIKCGHSVNEATAIALKDRQIGCPLDRKPFKKYYTNIALRNIVRMKVEEEFKSSEAKEVESKEQPSPSAIAHFERGKQLLTDKQYEQAVTAFLAALILFPAYEKAQAFFEFALESQKKNQNVPFSSPPTAEPSLAPPSTIPAAAIPVKDSLPSPKSQEKDVLLSTPLPEYLANALTPAGRGKALIQAVQEENISAIQYLLRQDTPLNVKDGMNRTPLSVACQKKNPIILSLLIKNGASVEGEDAKASLLSATKNGDREIVEILVKEGTPMMEKIVSNPNTTEWRCPPLEAVVQAGNVDLLQFFLSTSDRPNGLKLEANHTYIHKGGHNPAYCNKSVGDEAVITAHQLKHQVVIDLLLKRPEINLDKRIQGNRYGNSTLRSILVCTNVPRLPFPGMF